MLEIHTHLQSYLHACSCAYMPLVSNSVLPKFERILLAAGRMWLLKEVEFWKLLWPTSSYSGVDFWGQCLNLTSITPGTPATPPNVSSASLHPKAATSFHVRWILHDLGNTASMGQDSRGEITVDFQAYPLSYRFRLCGRRSKANQTAIMRQMSSVRGPFHPSQLDNKPAWTGTPISIP